MSITFRHPGVHAKKGQIVHVLRLLCGLRHCNKSFISGLTSIGGGAQENRIDDKLASWVLRLIILILKLRTLRQFHRCSFNFSFVNNFTLLNVVSRNSPSPSSLIFSPPHTTPQPPALPEDI